MKKLLMMILIIAIGGCVSAIEKDFCPYDGTHSYSSELRQCTIARHDRLEEAARLTTEDK